MNGTHTNEDCMEVMARYPDKHFDLAIIDPPYGIKDLIIGGGEKGRRLKIKNGLDKFDIVPTKEYFKELFRVSRNQIIWGANYFPEYLSHSRGWIVWDKKLPENFSFAKCELAYSSFNKNLDLFRYAAFSEKKEYHPTQKPVKLYEWLLTNYAKPNDLILDTHCGSASSLIACENLGFKYVACELDKDYYDQSMDRIKKHLAQGKLFERNQDHVKPIDQNLF